MQNLTFNFNQTSTVHSFADNKGELWFRANDICEILGYENPRRTVSLHCKEKGCQKIETNTKGGKQELTYINEPNLYRLIIKARKPEAEAFEEWVMEEVLPTIRKTGSYTVSDKPKKLTDKTTVSERTPLRNAVNLLVSKKGLNYSDAYSVVHQRFGVQSIEDLSQSELLDAVEYVHRLILDGEVLDKEPALTNKQLKPIMLLLAKLTGYAIGYRDLQQQMIQQPEKINCWLNTFKTPPEQGFLFVFKPDISRDIDTAGVMMHQYKHLIA